eukprot:1127408_1
MYLFKYYHACICYDQLIHSHHAQHHSITLCSINDISVGAHVPVSRPSTAITSPLKHIIQRSDMIQSKEVSIVCLYCVYVPLHHQIKCLVYALCGACIILFRTHQHILFTPNYVQYHARVCICMTNRFILITRSISLQLNIVVCSELDPYRLFNYIGRRYLERALIVLFMTHQHHPLNTKLCSINNILIDSFSSRFTSMQLDISMCSESDPSHLSNMSISRPSSTITDMKQKKCQ